MSTTTADIDHGHDDHGHDDQGHAAHSRTESKHGHGLTDKGYVGIAGILAVLTGAEVSLTYMHLPGGIFMTALIILMVTKFVIVVSFFMHLRFDNRIFSWLFYSGLLLAVFVYAAALCTFQFFAKS